MAVQISGPLFQISLADVYVFDMCEKVDSLVKLDDYPMVKKCRDVVAADPKIQKWVERRPVTDK